jgi:hypothetical protein
MRGIVARFGLGLPDFSSDMAISYPKPRAIL